MFTYRAQWKTGWLANSFKVGVTAEDIHDCHQCTQARTRT
jgi:hypothetical protein